MTVRQVLPERELAVDIRGGRHRGGHASGGHASGHRGGHRTRQRPSRPGGWKLLAGQPPRRNTSVRSGSHRARRRGRLTSVAVLGLVGAVAGSGLAGVGYLAAQNGPITTNGALSLHASAVSSLSGAAGVDGAATAMPGLAADPTFAFASSSASPTTKRARTSKASKTPRKAASAPPSPTPSPSPSLTSSSAPASGSPKPSPSEHPPTSTAPASAPSSPAPAPQPSSPSASAPAAGNGGATACTSPVFTTTSLYGTYTDVPYYVANDMWNVGSANASQTLDVCSQSDWSVTADINGGGNGVKTYPNAQRDFANAPLISSLNSVTSTFSESIPDSGTYETAYDIWLNAVANPSAGSDEVMIWTNNHGQIPGGSPQGTVTFDGVTYTAWKGDGNYFAFVANSAFTSGSLNLLDFFQWLMSQGWIGGDSTLVQVDYGVEVVATNGPETFSFNKFSVDAS